MNNRFLLSIVRRISPSTSIADRLPEPYMSITQEPKKTFFVFIRLSILYLLAVYLFKIMARVFTIPGTVVVLGTGFYFMLKFIVRAITFPSSITAVMFLFTILYSSKKNILKLIQNILTNCTKYINKTVVEKDAIELRNDISELETYFSLHCYVPFNDISEIANNISNDNYYFNGNNWRLFKVLFFPSKYIQDDLFSSIDMVRAHFFEKYKGVHISAPVTQNVSLDCAMIWGTRDPSERNTIDIETQMLNDQKEASSLRDKQGVLFIPPNACIYEYDSDYYSMVDFYIEKGYVIYVYNYRGYGGSNGTPSHNDNMHDLIYLSTYLPSLYHVYINIYHGISIGGYTLLLAMKALETSNKSTSFVVDRTFDDFNNMVRSMTNNWIYGLYHIFFTPPIPAVITPSMNNTLYVYDLLDEMVEYPICIKNTVYTQIESIYMGRKIKNENTALKYKYIDINKETESYESNDLMKINSITTEHSIEFCEDQLLQNSWLFYRLVEDVCKEANMSISIERMKSIYRDTKCTHDLYIPLSLNDYISLLLRLSIHGEQLIDCYILKSMNIYQYINNAIIFRGKSMLRVKKNDYRLEYYEVLRYLLKFLTGDSRIKFINQYLYILDIVLSSPNTYLKENMYIMRITCGHNAVMRSNELYSLNTFLHINTPIIKIPTETEKTNNNTNNNSNNTHPQEINGNTITGNDK
ncbi:hypothetical protein WA158_002567 [Blastocystis sp. Blastoise]